MFHAVARHMLINNDDFSKADFRRKMQDNRRILKTPSGFFTVDYSRADQSAHSADGTSNLPPTAPDGKNGSVSHVELRSVMVRVERAVSRAVRSCLALSSEWGESSPPGRFVLQPWPASAVPSPEPRLISSGLTTPLHFNFRTSFSSILKNNDEIIDISDTIDFD